MLVVALNLIDARQTELNRIFDRNNVAADLIHLAQQCIERRTFA